MKSDVVVIGGGVAGLATGALLAKQGKRVTVLEKGNRPGGRAYAYTEQGFTLNYGAHAMYRPHTGLLARVLEALGKPPIPCNFPDAMKAYWADGDRFAAVGAKPHQVMTTKLFGARTRMGMARLMLALRSAKVDALPHGMTWGEWLHAHTKDRALLRFINGLTTVNTYTRNPGELSARATLRHLQENLFAKDYAGYMSGGWGRMFDVFTGALEENGGTLVVGARVDVLEQQDGAVVAARTPDSRYEADAFVCTLPPQEAPEIALDGTPLRMELSRWQGMQDVRACTIDLGFSRRLRTDLTFIFDIERDLYYSLHSEVTPDLAPEGGQLLHAMAYLSPEDAASEAAAESRRRELEAGLDRFFPGWREAVVVERTLPNARVTGARRVPGQYEAGAVPLRPATASNLYFANDARDLPYFLSLTSLAAAMEVAEAIGAEAPRTRAREPITV